MPLPTSHVHGTEPPTPSSDTPPPELRNPDNPDERSEKETKASRKAAQGEPQKRQPEKHPLPGDAFLHPDDGAPAVVTLFDQDSFTVHYAHANTTYQLPFIYWESFARDLKFIHTAELRDPRPHPELMTASAHPWAQDASPPRQTPFRELQERFAHEDARRAEHFRTAASTHTTPRYSPEHEPPIESGKKLHGDQERAQHEVDTAAADKKKQPDAVPKDAMPEDAKLREKRFQETDDEKTKQHKADAEKAEKDKAEREKKR